MNYTEREIMKTIQELQKESKSPMDFVKVRLLALKLIKQVKDSKVTRTISVD